MLLMSAIGRLAEPPHRVVAALKRYRRIGSGVCESPRVKQALAMAFFKIPSACTYRRLAARSWRSSAAVVGFQLRPAGRRPAGRRHGGKRFLLPLIEVFGVDIQGAGSSPGRTAFTDQAQGLGPAGRIIAPTFAGWGAVFHDDGKVRPHYVLIYPTTSVVT